MITEVKKIWVCWEEHRILDNYEEVVDYSIDHGMVLTFGEWLTYHMGYSIEQVFEMTENEKKRLKAEYSEYVKARISDCWKEKEIVF